MRISRDAYEPKCYRTRRYTTMPEKNCYADALSNIRKGYNAEKRPSMLCRQQSDENTASKQQSTKRQNLNPT